MINGLEIPSVARQFFLSPAVRQNARLTARSRPPKPDLVVLREEFVAQLSAVQGKVLITIWAAMMTTPVLLAAIVAYLGSQSNAIERTPPAPPFIPMLVILGLCTLMASVFVRMVLGAPEKLLNSSDAPPPPFPGLNVSPTSAEETRLMVAANRYRVVVIVSLALAESCALFGFVASFMTGELHYVVMLGTCTIAVDATVLRPRFEIYSALAKRISATPS